MAEREQPADVFDDLAADPRQRGRCRVGARRLPAELSGPGTHGPHAATALRVLRNYAA
jgi:hypothetical protein